MTQRFLYLAIALAVVSAAAVLVTAEANAQVAASLYPSPRPVPPYVGYTYITYQPLAPQEFMYEHHRSYVRTDPCTGSTTRTRISYNHRCPIIPFTQPETRWHVPGLPNVPPAAPTNVCK